jgi:hypothetical protein
MSMSQIQAPAWFSSEGPSYEWHDFSYLRPAASNRQVAVSLFLIAWIAALDLCTPRTNFSVLYVAPLVLFAQSGSMRSGWRIAGLLVALTFGIHFIKNAIYPPPADMPFLYRQVNRTLVSVMLIAMSQVMRLWIRWHDEQDDLELPASFRSQEEEISATFAVLCCAPLIVLIALNRILAGVGLSVVALTLHHWLGRQKPAWQ